MITPQNSPLASCFSASFIFWVLTLIALAPYEPQARYIHFILPAVSTLGFSVWIYMTNVTFHSPASLSKVFSVMILILHIAGVALLVNASGILR